MFKKVRLFWDGLFGQQESIPKYRLIPNERGTYTLEKWSTNTEMYLAQAVLLTPDEADKVIENLERKTLYYRESR